MSVNIPLQLLTHPAAYHPSSTHPELATDSAPKERWNLDILESHAEARSKEIVGHIKAMVAECKLLLFP